MKRSDHPAADVRDAAPAAAVSHPAPPHPRAPQPAASPRRPAAPGASLEVISGPLSGAVFQVERLVLSIGRGDHNDVQLADHSVSAAHATLIVKGSVWHVVDLGSANGTYVDGYRVAGEQTLPSGCTLRVGDVKLTFRPRPSARGARGSVTAIFARLTRIFGDS
jgi:pSer/pThr/pTyr-binding forkhead associated (FHA) protein